MTTKGVLLTVCGAWAASTEATHSNVLPGTAGIDAGHTTVALRWRFARRVCSMDVATCAVFTFAFALSLELEEPQAPSSAAQASAVMAKIAPRAGDAARVLLEVGRSFRMRAY